MPMMIGMPTRNTIVVPCIVNRRLKTCGDNTVLFGTASWSRISDASKPATKKKNSPEPMYMTPSRLWSTVTTHSCSSSMNDSRSAAGRAPVRV